MGIDPILHQMLQLALKETQDSEVLAIQAASRRDMGTALLKGVANLADEQFLPDERNVVDDDENGGRIPLQKGAVFHQMVQLAREAVVDRQDATAAGQLKQLADLADKQGHPVSPQKGAILQMLQLTLKEIQDSEVLETQAASRRAMATALLKQFADLASKQCRPQTESGEADGQNALPTTTTAIFDPAITTTSATATSTTTTSTTTTSITTTAPVASGSPQVQAIRQPVSFQKGPSFHQMLQSARQAIVDRQYATAVGQLKQLADLADKLLAPAWDELQARWTPTLQARLRAALADPTIPTVDSDACRPLETQLHECLQGKDFAKALEILDQLEPALKKAVFNGNLVKGETKKRRDQTHAYESMRKQFDFIGKTVFLKGEADRILERSSEATEKLRDFLNAVKVHENHRGEATLKNLENKGHAFLTSSGPATEKLATEKQIVREMMQWARFDGLRLEYQKIGPPRWDAENENRAGALTAAYLFEEGALISRTGEDKTAKLLEDESGVSGAWWIRRLGGVLGEETVRQFIFKPADREPLFKELPKGGAAIREVMAKTINEQVALMTGLDFGVCPTYLVGVSTERLPEANGRPDTTLGPVRTGMMQQLAPNRGQIEDCFNEGGPDFFRAIPSEEILKVAILNLIILNFDRHGRNVLVDGYPPRMIPIDHGKSLPTREGFSMGKRQIEEKNYFLGHSAPQMDERFSPEMLAIIDLIDPDQLVKGMKASRDALVKQHPDQQDKLGDESVEMARRSVLFLKKAASHLTVKELMQAYMTVLESVFDAPPDRLEAAIDQAVRTAVDRKAAGSKLDAYGRENAKKELQALGWFTINPNNPTRILHNEEQETFLKEQGSRVLKILQGKIENPAVRKRFDELLREVGAENLTFDPEAFSIQEALTRLNEVAVKRKKEDLDKVRRLVSVGPSAAEQLLADLKEFHEAEGDMLIDGADKMNAKQTLEAYKQKLEAYGQDLMEKRAGKEDPEAYFKRMEKEFGGSVSARSPASLAKARYLQTCQEFERLGGKAEYQRLLGKPYSVNNGPQEEMFAMLNAESVTSVDRVDLNAARKKAIEVGIQRLKKVAPPPPHQARATAMFMSHLIPSALVELSSRIERQMKVLQANLDGGQYDAAETILAELEAEVDRAVQGDNSDIARLDARIEAARDEVTELRQSEEQQTVARALQAVEALRRGWKLPQCETALGKLEKSAYTLANKQATLSDRRRLQKDSKKQALESRLRDLHQKIQNVKENPYLKGRYTEFSQRYWGAIKTKDEWNIDEATELIERIEKEIDAVQPIVPKLEVLRGRIDEVVVRIKGLPTKVLKDKTYDEEVALLIQGARKWITAVGAVEKSAVGLDKPEHLEVEVTNANRLLDRFESELEKVVAKYPTEQ